MPDPDQLDMNGSNLEDLITSAMSDVEDPISLNYKETYVVITSYSIHYTKLYDNKF